MNGDKSDLEQRIEKVKRGALFDLECGVRPPADRLDMIASMIFNAACMANRHSEFADLILDLGRRPEQADIAAAAAALRDLWGMPPAESVTRPRQVYGVLIEPVVPMAPGQNQRWQTLVTAHDIHAAIRGVTKIVQNILGLDLGEPRFDKPEGGPAEYQISLVMVLGAEGDEDTEHHKALWLRETALGNKFMVFDPGYEESQL